MQIKTPTTFDCFKWQHIWIYRALFSIYELYFDVFLTHLGPGSGRCVDCTSAIPECAGDVSVSYSTFINNGRVGNVPCNGQCFMSILPDGSNKLLSFYLWIK